MIVFFAFISDFDVLLSKYAKNENHRMLITHSIIPSLIIIILGHIIDWPALYISGYGYSKEEFENISEYLSKYKNPASFFDEKYYNNKICMVIEVLIFILMILSITFLAFPYIILISIYFPLILFHLYRHFNLKKNESQEILK